jgi:hypothetical protein
MSNLRRRSMWVGMSLGMLAACGGQKVHTVGNTAAGDGGSTGTALPSVTCGNDAKDADESDIDCGGICAACPASASCTRHADCASGVCRAAVCQEGTCDDETTNGNESDVDCGPGCATCEDGKACTTSADCKSEVCANGICRAPTCDDGVQNAQESALDCGGSCAGCPDGEDCADGRDCASSLCEAGQCVSCHDRVTNGGESDEDCGGSVCIGCGEGQSCVLDGDCASNACSSSREVSQKVCFPAHCNNQQVDADETDLDCGGGSCVGCFLGRKCTKKEDCDDLGCVDGYCAQICETDRNCDSPRNRCEDGRCVSCHSSADCPQGMCDALGEVCACAGGSLICNPP